MKKKIELGTVIFIVIAAVFLACFATYMYLTSLMPSLVAKENFYDRISEISKTIEQRYVGEYNENLAMDSLLTGYVTGIDKYSTYLDADSYAEYMAQLDGKYSGIGITVKYNSQTSVLKVIEVNSNSPADSAGIKIGDVIVKISDKSVSDLSYDEAVSLLKGETGTVIDLVVLRDEKEIEKSVTISQYITSSVKSNILYNNIGYLSISEFTNTTFDDFKSAMKKLAEDGANKYIFDMRNNVGGNLTAVVNILDYILPEGKLVSLKNKTGDETVYESDASKLENEFVVLINGSTYSGGELFAAAVRDFKAGKLIGETTYGKGYAQEFIPLSVGALYLSTKLYYPPNGENYEGIGVSPDVVVALDDQLEQRFYELKTEEDTQLVAALNQLGITFEKENEKINTDEKTVS